jgi:hypothetical protein
MRLPIQYRALPLVLMLLSDLPVAAPAAVPPTCAATPADLQALRDNLEIINNQVVRARNEGGPEQGVATAAVATAVRAFEEAVGHAMAPSPESQLITVPRGTKHPHMQVVHQAFSAAQRAFEKARCALPGSPEPLQKALADLERTLQFR